MSVVKAAAYNIIGIGKVPVSDVKAFQGMPGNGHRMKVLNWTLDYSERTVGERSFIDCIVGKNFPRRKHSPDDGKKQKKHSEGTKF